MTIELVIILISAVFIILGAYLWQKASHLIAKGKKATAIIFTNNYHPGKDGGNYYPVVRFLTDKQEWVTQELSIGYTPAKREGTRLEVIYDPEDPTTVEINSAFQLIVLPRLLVVVGIVGLIVGALEYLQVTHIIDSVKDSN